MLPQFRQFWSGSIGVFMARNITKKDLIDGIVSRTGIDAKRVRRVSIEFLNAICLHLARHERIEIREFGVFSVMHRKRRIARNPRTGEPAEVREGDVPVFKFSPHIRKKVSSPRTVHE